MAKRRAQWTFWVWDLPVAVFSPTTQRHPLRCRPGVWAKADGGRRWPFAASHANRAVSEQRENHVTAKQPFDLPQAHGPIGRSQSGRQGTAPTATQSPANLSHCQRIIGILGAVSCCSKASKPPLVKKAGRSRSNCSRGSPGCNSLGAKPLRSLPTMVCSPVSKLISVSPE